MTRIAVATALLVAIPQLAAAPVGRLLAHAAPGPRRGQPHAGHRDGADALEQEPNPVRGAGGTVSHQRSLHAVAGVRVRHVGRAAALIGDGRAGPVALARPVRRGGGELFRRRFVRAACAGLLIGAVANPTSAQPRSEVELGGGFHAAIAFGDLIVLPSTPTVDARAVRWLNDRWGIAGRVLVGIGSNRPDEHAVVERRRPTYVQVTARYRAASTGKTTWHVGFGGGMMWAGETVRYRQGITAEKYRWGPHYVALEALASRAVTKRFQRPVRGHDGPAGALTSGRAGGVQVLTGEV